MADRQHSKNCMAAISRPFLVYIIVAEDSTKSALSYKNIDLNAYKARLFGEKVDSILFPRVCRLPRVHASSLRYNYHPMRARLASVPFLMTLRS